MKTKKFLNKVWRRIKYPFVKPKLVITKASFSGDRNFIDIRFWLSRPDKMNAKVFPYIITAENQKIGLMHLSKFGVIKTKLRKKSNTGILLFYNKNKTVGIGDSVTLYWNEFKVENIVVK